MKYFLFYFALLLSNSLFSQKEQKVYVILNNEKLFQLNSINEDSYSLKVAIYSKKDSWLKKDLKRNNTNDDDIVIINSFLESQKFYRFYSLNKPVDTHDISDLKVFNIEEVSKGNKKIFKKYPYLINFIQIVDCDKYIIREMHLIMEE